MKRYLRANKYTLNSDIIFSDSIQIHVDIDTDKQIYALNSIQRFPGKDQFRQDAIDILESFGFDIITDVYDGKMQKGHFSNREDSISLYFDTYYDLHNAKDHISIADVSKLEIPEKSKVYCFVHIRISDHILNDEGDIEHREYIDKINSKYVDANPEVNHTIEDEIELNEYNVHLAYDQALDDLEYLLQYKLVSWLHMGDSRVKRVKGRG